MNLLHLSPMIKRIIPSSGEELPVIGIGTWQSFDVNEDKYPVLTNVLSELHAGGGNVIDSSPMYGRSEKAIGDITSAMAINNDFFYATKVWTTGLIAGIKEMTHSMHLMKRKKIDLMQIHNLVDWKTHMQQLRLWKEEGKIRYWGITHYTEACHEEMEKIMKAVKPDFVQFNYSITERNAEKRLLGVAADLGIATLINRPFGSGSLFKKIKDKPLPPWAKEYSIDSWSNYFLTYIIAHPAVTCIIPATANPLHARENTRAAAGKLPDVAMKTEMVNYINSL